MQFHPGLDVIIRVSYHVGDVARGWWCDKPVDRIDHEHTCMLETDLVPQGFASQVPIAMTITGIEKVG
jgi:hypothetical protein